MRTPYRRTHSSKPIKHKIKYIVPPFPITGYVDKLRIDDNIFMFMAPCAGAIKDVSVEAASVDEGVEICLIVYKEGNVIYSKVFPISAGYHELDDMEVDLLRGEKAVLYIRGGEADDMWFSCNFIAKIDSEYVIRISYTDAERLEILGKIPS